MLAAALGKPNAVKVLLKHGASPSSSDKLQWTALHWAASSRCLGSARALLAASAAPDVRDMKTATPLLVACRGGHDKIVSLFAEFETTPHKLDLYGRSALHDAAESSPAAFQTLLQLGWDPYLLDTHGARLFFFRYDQSNFEAGYSTMGSIGRVCGQLVQLKDI
jgi:ankyrin repeat protein